MMLPKNITLYPIGDELVSLRSVYKILDEQQHFYAQLLQQQERNYRAFLQMLMECSSGRVDALVREMQDTRNDLRVAKDELAEVKKQLGLSNKRAECMAESLVATRAALDGLSGKSGGAESKPRKGGGGLRQSGLGKQKSEPKALKLVTDLTDIHFEGLKVVLAVFSVTTYFMVEKCHGTTT